MSTWRRALCGLLAAGLLALTGCAAQSAPAETTLFAMTTTMSLTIYGPNREEALAAAVDTIYDLDRRLGVTGPEGAAARLNSSAGEWVELDPDQLDLLARSLDLSRLTGGALDLTAYTALKAWGFPSGDYRVPDPAELEALAAAIDYTALELDLEGQRARLPKNMALDFGAVGKGYTGDRLTTQLREAGISSALLDLGQSSMAAVGGKPDGSPWRIGIGDPQSPQAQAYLGVLELQDQAMGTSGVNQRFFERDGEVYGHILDPDTAAPARTGLASVTVVSPSCLLCDGLSTALFVMG